MRLIFFLVGFVPFMIMQSKKRRNTQLLKTGRAIQAKVTVDLAIIVMATLNSRRTPFAQF